MATRTLPNLELTTTRQMMKPSISASMEVTNSAARVGAAWTLKPRISLKSVRPLLPPKPKLLRKKPSSSANVSACVMIDRYTPVTRLRKANQPNTKASAPGTSSTMMAAYQKWSKKYQKTGSSFQFRNTMKRSEERRVGKEERDGWGR